MRYIAVAVFTLFTGVLRAANPPGESLDLPNVAGGELTATLHTAGDAVVTFNYRKDGCFFNPNHADPCFTFSAVNGTGQWLRAGHSMCRFQSHVLLPREWKERRCCRASGDCTLLVIH